jgi:Family of unknown function (DUF5926)/SEC-C motif
MAKRSRTATPEASDVPVVGGREPCPCGSGRRYKACHGRARAETANELVRRPFEGLPGEVDWVMMREIVPAATARVRVASGEHAGREATVSTVLPFAWPALSRLDGEVFVGLQVTGGSGDRSRDAAHALLAALAAEPGTPQPPEPAESGGPRLQDVLDLEQPFDVVVHDGFDFWIEGVEEVDAETRASLDRANSAVIPTARLTSVSGAYWARMRDRAHLRWGLGEPEDALLDAMARLHGAGGLSLGDGTRYVGAFRADGILVPVWDLPHDRDPEEVEGPAAGFRSRLDQALALGTPLTGSERRARNGLLSRQLTLR